MGRDGSSARGFCITGHRALRAWLPALLLAMVAFMLGASPLRAAATSAEATRALAGSIVDIDTQWTQDRLDEVRQAGETTRILRAWRNDKAVSEIALAADGDAYRNVRASVSDLTGPAGTISSDNVRALFVSSTKAYDGRYLGYGDPNRAVPADDGSNRSESSDIINAPGPIDMPADTVRPLWLTFSIPHDAAAGTYTATVTVSADGLVDPLTFTYTVEVRDALLPDATEFKSAFDIELWQYPYASAEYYGVEPFSEEHKQILRSSLELYRAVGGHAITTTISEDAWNGQTYSANPVHYPSMVRWTRNDDGSFSYDFTDFDAWVELCREMGLGDKIVLYSIAPWHNSFTYWEGGVLKRERFSPGSERYRQVWGDFLNKMVDHLMERGWFDEAYVGIDERGFSKEAFDLIDSVRNIHGKSLKTAGAMDGFVNKRELALRVTDLNVGDTAAAAHPREFAKLLRDRAAKGYRTTLYSCTEHQPGNFSLSAPVESYWSVVNAGKETEGFLRWAFDAWVADPLRDATHNAFEPGDPFLIYPSERDAAEKVAWSSVRLERMAEAVRDVNKVRTMVREAPALKADADALFARIRTVPRTARSYFSAAQVSELSRETASFKEGLDELTERYVDLKRTASTEVASVSIEGAPAELMVGREARILARVLPDNLLNPTVTWSSSDDGTASVDADGLVRGHRVGTVEITATSTADPSKSATARIAVVPIALETGYAYYSFDGDDVRDSWGSRDGTVVDGASFMEGKSGRALKVGGGARATLPSPSEIGEDDPWTVSYWVMSDAELSSRSSVMADASGSFSFDLKMSPTRASGMHVGKRDRDVLTFSYPFKAHTWYHVTWTQSKDAGLSMYVNGDKVETNAWTRTNRVVAPIDVLGGEGMSGLIDELKVYRRVLDDAEVKANMLLPGLNLAEREHHLFVGETHAIAVNLVSDAADKTVTFTSSDPSVASVSEAGVVTALARGTATITVENRAGGYRDEVLITVEKHLPLRNTLPEYALPADHLSDVHKSEDTRNQYFGQPDMVRTRTGRLITSFPQGHGKGPLIMKVSDDNGATWARKDDTPRSWEGSQETPTMYTMTLPDGRERIMLITACPGWGRDSAGNRFGWNTSFSDDDGETWSEYRHFYPRRAHDNADNDAVVAMASLVQLHDAEGRPLQRWMGVYHNQAFVNYKTYLTFDENGQDQWSEPEPLIPEYREVEGRIKMCEIGMFRSPDGRRIVGLARSQSHNDLATLIYSDDEGATWSEPMSLPGSLAGERHKAAYDPVSGRLLITFREIRYDSNGNGRFDGNADWVAGEWVAWVGTYEDLMNQNEGSYRIVLAEDWANNAKSGDTGYAGVTVLPDGTFVMDSYGHWDKEFSQSWPHGVTTDRCYIKQASFKLGEMDRIAGLVSTEELERFVSDIDAEGLAQEAYTLESWQPFAEALDAARAILTDVTRQQVEIDAALTRLRKGREGLREKAGNPDAPDPSQPTDPVEPAEPTDPEQPSEPTEPEEPAGPVQPTDPTEPTGPEHPAEPAKPAHPAQPGDPNATVTTQGAGETGGDGSTRDEAPAAASSSVGSSVRGEGARGADTGRRAGTEAAGATGRSEDPSLASPPDERSEQDADRADASPASSEAKRPQQSGEDRAAVPWLPAALIVFAFAIVAGLVAVAARGHRKGN